MARTLELLKETAEAYDMPLDFIEKVNEEHEDEEFYNALDQELINRRTRNSK